MNLLFYFKPGKINLFLRQPVGPELLWPALAYVVGAVNKIRL